MHGANAVPAEMLTAAVRRETLKGGSERVAVFMGSAFKYKAVQPLLDGLPSPRARARETERDTDREI